MNRRAFLLGAAMLMLCNLVSVTLRSYAEATFLASYGATHLPYLLIASAGGFAVATFAYDQITRHAHTRIVDIAVLVVLFIAGAAAPSLLSAGLPPVVLVVALTATSQVAGLALWNRVAAAVAGRDARRNLPRAGAAVTLGGAIAGLGAGALVYRFGVTTLPYIGAGATIAVLALALAQDKALTAGGAPGAALPAGASDVLNPLHKSLLRALIAVAILEGIVATVIDFQFVVQLKARYSGDTLATAIVLFYGGTNALLFLLQVTAVPHILVTRSVPTTAAIHPIFAIVWYAVFVAAPGFVAIAGTRTSDQILRLATSRTSQEIELSPLPPGPRARWKVLLRGGIWPAGASFAALVLLLIGPSAIQYPNRLAAAAVVVAAIWFLVAQLAARRFQAALAAPLGMRTHRTDDLVRIDLGTLERWSHAAGSDDPRTAAIARAALTRARVAPSDLADHLRHDEADVRIALFAHLARSPAPELKGELCAAVMIEDDDRALATGIEAVALCEESAPAPGSLTARALDRGRSRAQVSASVAAALRSAEVTLARNGDAASLRTEVARLLAHDPTWAVALIRRRRAELPNEELTQLLRDAPRMGAMHAIAHVGPEASIPLLDEALVANDAQARAAIVGLDVGGAAHLAAHMTRVSPLARLFIARALAGAPVGAALVGALISDEDPDVAHAALRTALAIARGGTSLPAGPIADANAKAKGALLAHLDARDASGPWSPCAKHELELATQRCVARLLWATAVEAAAGGRDPATLAATARRLIGGKDPERKRALDVLQEVQAGRAEILAVIERWLRPPVPATDTEDTILALSLYDPWLADLGSGATKALEPRLSVLRKPAMFATVSGPALAALAHRATEREINGQLFALGDPGSTMFIVLDGDLHAERPNAASRTISIGGVVGELAVLTRAPRAATISGTARVLEIDRDTYLAAASRAPELVSGLAATLAGWLSPERPDILG